MPWTKVDTYMLGFRSTDKKFWLYYTLQGSSTATQIFLTPAQFTAAAALFGSGVAVSYETSGNYFATAPKPI